VAEIYTLEQLHEDLWYLNHKLEIMEALEYAIDNYWNFKDQFDGTWDEAVAIASGEQGSIVGAGDLGKLGGVPETCSEIISIDPSPFTEAADGLSPVNLMFVDIEDDPGQILTKVIGSWYSSAADAFEEHLCKYSPVQARQAELSAILINACTSANEVVASCHQSIRNLIATASETADVINQTYEAEKKRLDKDVSSAALLIVGTVLTAGTASGAAAIATSTTVGATNLAQNIATANMASKEFKAKSSDDFVDEINNHLVGIIGVLQEADGEIYGEINEVQSLWSMRECTIPAPLKSDEFEEDSFYHESNF